MALDKASLLDGSNPKAPNISVLIFFIFALLWLILSGVALSGAALDPASGGTNLVKGVLALLAVALLASRVRIAPAAVTILGVIILAAPFYVPSFKGNAQYSGVDSESIERIARELAKPPAQRNLTWMNDLTKRGYQEPPDLAKIIAERPARIEAWLRDNAAAVRSMETQISKSRACDTYASPAAFHAALLNYLQAPKAYSGTNWVWFGLWLSHARELGFKESEELTPEQVQSATDYAREWLEAHPDAVKVQLGIMETNEVDEQEIHVHEVSAASTLSISLWIVLFAVGAAWAGRQAFHRPWDPFQFPAWVREGMRRLIRRDRFAVARILGGLAAMGLIGALIAVLAAAHFNNRPVGKLIVSLMVMAGMVVCSGLSFGEDEPPKAKG
jgi:hypothetical protein